MKLKGSYFFTPIEWKVQKMQEHFRFLYVGNQQLKKRRFFTNFRIYHGYLCIHLYNRLV